MVAAGIHGNMFTDSTEEEERRIEEEIQEHGPGKCIEKLLYKQEGAEGSVENDGSENRDNKLYQGLLNMLYEYAQRVEKHASIDTDSEFSSGKKMSLKALKALTGENRMIYNSMAFTVLRLPNAGVSRILDEFVSFRYVQWLSNFIEDSLDYKNDPTKALIAKEVWTKYWYNEVDTLMYTNPEPVFSTQRFEDSSIAANLKEAASILNETYCGVNESLAEAEMSQTSDSLSAIKARCDGIVSELSEISDVDSLDWEVRRKIAELMVEILVHIEGHICNLSRNAVHLSDVIEHIFTKYDWMEVMDLIETYTDIAEYN